MGPACLPKVVDVQNLFHYLHSKDSFSLLKNKSGPASGLAVEMLFGMPTLHSCVSLQLLAFLPFQLPAGVDHGGLQAVVQQCP